MKVDVIELPNSQVIQRFVDLPRLFDLLISEQVFFPTLETLAQSDPFECAIPVRLGCKTRKRAQLESEAMSLLPSVPGDLKTGDRDYDYNRYKRWLTHCTHKELVAHVSEMELKLYRFRIVCSCWHLSEGENDAMWKIYGGQLGVMLVSTVGRLAKAIKGHYSFLICSPDPQNYEIARVRYVSNTTPKRLPRFYRDKPWLLKRKAFEHERELRVCHRLSEMASNHDGGILLQMDPQELIQEIVLSPFNRDWINSSLASALGFLVKQRQFGIPIRIRESKHMAKPANRSAVLHGLELDKLGRSLGAGPRLRVQPRHIGKVR
jgi:hypothetical protein